MVTNKTIYFPGLNGFRAIAALGVVIGHIIGSLTEFNLSPFIFGYTTDGEPKGYILGGFGVSIFFVLSGFLITYLLLAEKEKNDINIKKFYLRRILRIWPLYYLYLILSITTIAFFGLDLDIEALFFYLFYTANIPFILGFPIPLLAHYWSLGVEEQFYAFWPWIVKRFDKMLLKIVISIIIILIVAKIALHFLHPNSIWEMVIHVTRFHCMMIGGAGAILFKQNNKLFLTLIDHKITQTIAWLVLGFVMINRFHFASIIDNELISIVALILIIGQIQVKNRIVNLENKVFDFLGKISYGMYVIHPLLIFLFSKVFSLIDIEGTTKYIAVFFSIIGSTVILSYLSYHYFERYFLNYKKKFVVVMSAGTKIH